MRKIHYIVIHCTATEQNAKVDSILKYWRNTLGWNSPGYHFIITPDGDYRKLQPLDLPANGVKGYNTQSVHVSYVGGIDDKGKALDNRTPEQKATMLCIVEELKMKFPNAKVLGHRDFPGVNKDCPSFDAKAEYQNIK